MINKNIGCVRVVYNAAINIKNEGLRILDGTVGNTETGVIQDTPMSVENPTMDDKFVLQTLKSSDSMKQELLYKDLSAKEGPLL